MADFIDWHVPVIMLLFILADIVTGLIKAFKNHDVNSEKMRAGLLNKMVYVVLLFVAYLIEYAVDFFDMGINIPIAITVATYICLTELVSICENAAEINPALKNSKLLQAFKSTKTLTDGKE